MCCHRRLFRNGVESVPIDFSETLEIRYPGHFEKAIGTFDTEMIEGE